MTAINAFLLPAKAVLMTDAAMYSRHGLVFGFGQKTIALPTLKAAIAVRGVQKTGALLAMEMSTTFTTFDDFARVGAAYFKLILPQLMTGLDEAITDVEIVAVGWSDELGRPIGFAYSSEGFGEIDGYVMAPLPDDVEEANLASLGVSIDVNVPIAAFDAIKHGVPLMEAQRRMRIIPPASDLEEGISIVGGNALLTEVTKDGVSQRVIHRWPDEVGENIEPEPFTVQPLSRQQRRRAERAAA